MERTVSAQKLVKADEILVKEFKIAKKFDWAKKNLVQLKSQTNIFDAFQSWGSALLMLYV